MNEFEKRYQALLKQHKREERMQKIKMKIEINRILFRYRIKKILFGIK